MKMYGTSRLSAPLVISGLLLVCGCGGENADDSETSGAKEDSPESEAAAL